MPAVKATTSAKLDKRSKNSLSPGRWKMTSRPAPLTLTLNVPLPCKAGGTLLGLKAHTIVSSRSKTTCGRRPRLTLE